MTSPTILVTGATGRTGGAVAELLLDRGARVRALVRARDGRSERLRRRGADIVVGDLFDATSVSEALRGVRRAYFVPPWHAHMLDSAAAFASAARESDLESLVWLTQWLANPVSPSPTTRQHHLVDQILWTLPDVAKTCLNPGYFADSYLQTMNFAAHLGLFPSPTGSSSNAPPSNQDIARVAVTALTDPNRHAGRTYRPTGPELLDAAQMAAVIGHVLDRPVRHIDLPVWMFLRAAKLSGVSPIELLNIGHYFAEHRRGTFAIGAPTDDVATVTGTPAEPFAVTAARYAAMPFAARTPALVARTILRFLRIGITPTPNAERQARALQLPQLAHPALSIDSPDWQHRHAQPEPQTT